jgi:hypothetical protein
MNYEQRVIVRFLCKEGVLPAEIHTRVEAQFGEDAYSCAAFSVGASFFDMGGKICMMLTL